MYKPDYPFDGQPNAGETIEVVPSVHWLRMPLPFKLDHINLWLLDDDDGWTIVDTGIATDEVKENWKRIDNRYFQNKPAKRVIVTHFHPDHVGLAGWLSERFGVPMWMPLTEWALGRMLSLDTAETIGDNYHKFYRAAGFDDSMTEMIKARVGRYSELISPIPSTFTRVADDDEINIGGRRWRVIVGTGHAPEHACLYCQELGVLISGDQILPRISPNISVLSHEPDADPLRQFLSSLEKFRPLPHDTLVLPSHDWPFHGLQGRVDDLVQHHLERLEETFACCHQPATGVDVLRRLFDRELDNHQVFFAIGESLAHLHYLVGEDRVTRYTDEDHVHRFHAV